MLCKKHQIHIIQNTDTRKTEPKDTIFLGTVASVDLISNLGLFASLVHFILSFKPWYEQTHLHSP